MCGHRHSHRGNTETAIAGQLDCRTPQIETCNKAEDVEFESLDPCQLYAQQTPKVTLDTGMTVRQTEIRLRPKVTAEAFDGNAVRISGTARSTDATNVLLLGPGHMRYSPASRNG